MAEHSIRKHLLLNITFNVNIFRPTLDVFYSVYLKFNCRDFEEFYLWHEEYFFEFGRSSRKNYFFVELNLG